MNTVQQDMLNYTARLYFQFQKQYPTRHSFLFDDVMLVNECSIASAEKTASTLCNVVSWWLLNYCQGFTNISFRDYFSMMQTTKVINKNGKEVFCCSDKGFFNAEKDIISPAIFGYNFDIEYFEDYEDLKNPLTVLDPEYGYQLKMKGDTSGFHFLSAYIDNKTNILMGVDTSYRGTPFVLSKKITADNFVWLLKIKKS